MSFKRAEPIRWPKSLKEQNNPSVLTITRNTLRCVTSMHHKEDKWVKMHVVSLKDGLTFFDFRSNEGQRVEIKVFNY